MTYEEALRAGERLLSEAGIEEAVHDAAELLFHTTGLQSSTYLLRKREQLPEKQRKRYAYFLRKRSLHEPLQHITGVAWFYGLPFYVSKAVLVPRFDTELLADTVLRTCPDRNIRILDLCTGSGCLAVTLKKEGGYREVAAADLSLKALRKARLNAERHGTDIRFFQGDLFSGVEGIYDVIVSNPPYIASEEIPGLAPEVKDHDPRMALTDGKDGLSFYRRIAEECRPFLSDNGRIFLEIGSSQTKAVTDFFLQAGFRKTEVGKDLAGMDRMVIVYR